MKGEKSQKEEEKKMKEEGILTEVMKEEMLREKRNRGLKRQEEIHRGVWMGVFDAGSQVTSPRNVGQQVLWLHRSQLLHIGCHRSPNKMLPTSKRRQTTTTKRCLWE